MDDMVSVMKKFYSKVESYQHSNKLTDVTVECEDGSSRCHRLVLSVASDYFEDIFVNEKADEKITSTISLPIKLKTFEQILEFVYTGYVDVKASNILALLEACEIMKLPEIEKLCVQFVRTDDMTAQRTLEVFLFAQASGKFVLSNLLSSYIARNFEICSHISKFYEIPPSDMKMILNHLSWLPSKNDEAILSAICRWIQHQRKERLSYFDEFVKTVTFEDISSTYMKHIFTRLFVDSNLAEAFSSPEKPAPYDENSQLPHGATTSESEKFLHFFVKPKHDAYAMKIYSINNASVCVNTADMRLNHPQQRIQAVGLGDFYLYVLNFALDPTSVYKDQVFCAYTSVDMESQFMLKQAPVLFSGENTAMSIVQNNIYAYQSSDRVNRSFSSNSLSDDEINRGIYVYNCEVNKWFSVPAMQQRTTMACMTTLNDVIYLIGGGDKAGTIPKRYAQMYDCRVGRWYELPKSRWDHYGAACTEMNGNIYVSGGAHPGDGFERYVQTAGKWETLAPMPRTRMYHRSVNYSDQVWIAGNNENELDTSDLSVDIYDPQSNAWNSMCLFTENGAVDPGAGVVIQPVPFRYSHSSAC